MARVKLTIVLALMLMVVAAQGAAAEVWRETSPVQQGSVTYDTTDPCSGRAATMTVNSNITDVTLVTPAGTINGKEFDQGTFTLAIAGGPTITGTFTGQGGLHVNPQGQLVATFLAQYDRTLPDGSTQTVRFVFQMVQRADGAPVVFLEQFTCVG
jgi:hypothetical protein